TLRTAPGRLPPNRPGGPGRRRLVPLPVDNPVDTSVEIPLGAGDNCGCPVDDQRILKMRPETPCARSHGRCRNSFTAKDGYRFRGKPRERLRSRVTGTPGGYPITVV